MAIDHMVLKVSADKYQETLKFYTEVLKTLDYELRHSVGDVVAGLGLKSGPTGAADLWLAVSDTPIEMHVAFRAENRSVVDAFHAAALAAGGSDNGAPGLRPQYHPDYYAAYITDPAGNNIEAVHHHPA
ncbi:glyoxalase family protein [Cordyceps fumosorosea ARSEF 2679]|uniref:Glyoxalase family protein n=1 Tax=Cordyceps fumosorosea (strain ARSEF 2679) TaxID=1081104 RepID=A0A167WHZ9_CORFA|nr:glyoxalase family protein [Cordyceps fumosorosea ARSEF 2679]OAA63815.1 glyoxalase family protein [Cordyceps fumosorosea ARSEF 2679]